MTIDPATLNDWMVRAGWKPNVIPIVSEFSVSESRHRAINFADVQQVRFMAIKYWNSTEGLHTANMRDWRVMMALSIARYAWWKMQPPSPSENPALPVSDRLQ